MATSICARCGVSLLAPDMELHMLWCKTSALARESSNFPIPKDTTLMQLDTMGYPSLPTANYLPISISDTLDDPFSMHQGAGVHLDLTPLRRLRTDSSSSVPLPVPLSRNPSSGSSQEYAEKHQTIVILDYDDTLCPTSFMKREGLVEGAFGEYSPAEQEKINKYKPELEELAIEGQKLIELAFQVAGQVVVITDAQKEWVFQTSRCWLPSLHETLFPRVDILSVRDACKNAFPDISPSSRKTFGFCEKITKFYTMYPNQSWKNIISIGDGPAERRALDRVVRGAPSEKKCRSKVVKFVYAPEMHQLIQELQMMQDHLDEIVKVDDDCDLYFATVDRLRSGAPIPELCWNESDTRELGQFALGYKVAWKKSDDKIPDGSVGEIIGFTRDRICVKFPEGSWKFDSSELIAVTSK